ncbi:SdpI family protein [Actinotalea sp. M2MS4P-6]|uniref:SdpI family protein n=1 Tax=Actinotalea sp. M2MS4P-6 TaxID=2983762 RepID=UPI0021E40934|nr:SdpI family protein [Actinotalea sp. M2MS4P-6]MCV2392754.1 SdpI family protein [Actinotalea sp. M2MS4P-6]
MSEADALRLAALLVGVVLGAGAVVVAVVVQQAAAGRLGPNSWAGMRTKETLAGPRQWREAHRAALGATWIGAIGTVAAGLLAVQIRDAALLAGVLVAGAVWALVWVLIGLARGEQAAREVSRRR